MKFNGFTTCKVKIAWVPVVGCFTKIGVENLGGKWVKDEHGSEEFDIQKAKDIKAKLNRETRDSTGGYIIVYC